MARRSSKVGVQLILHNAESKKPALGGFFTQAELEMVGRVGFEPTTNWLKANCSTN